MMEGISRLVWGLTIRPMQGWIWVVLSGALGIVLIVSIETIATWLFALLVGVQLISIGASVGYVALMARRAAAS